MKFIGLKIFVIALITLSLLAMLLTQNEPLRMATRAGDDVATMYKTKCAVCHTPKATKFFDPSKENSVLVEVIMKGKKGEKPPYMPEFESKGLTAEQAQFLVEHMRNVRKASESNSNSNSDAKP